MFDNIRKKLILECNSKWWATSWNRNEQFRDLNDCNCKNRASTIVEQRQPFFCRDRFFFHPFPSTIPYYPLSLSLTLAKWLSFVRIYSKCQHSQRAFFRLFTEVKGNLFSSSSNMSKLAIAMHPNVQCVCMCIGVSECNSPLIFVVFVWGVKKFFKILFFVYSFCYYFAHFLLSRKYRKYK